MHLELVGVPLGAYFHSLIAKVNFHVYKVDNVGLVCRETQICLVKLCVVFLLCI
jgi:hypothetical protein